MCGRFTNRYSWRQLKELYDLTAPYLESNFPPRYNIAPTQDSFVVRLKQGKRALDSMRWGLVPWFSKDTKGAARMINAQSETADVKPAFRDPWRQGRCLVVADGFYEWPEPKRPRFITLKGNTPFAFAGLWDTWGPETLKTFTILTTTPNDFMAEVHNRMPVMLAPEAWSTWLGETSANAAALKALCVPFPSERMTCWPVDPAVGNHRNDEPRLIEAVPLDPPVAMLF
jgi:putative SOS response-associated peptidase YedK